MTAVKTSSTARVNNTVTADPDLQVALTAGTWAIELDFNFDQASSVATNNALQYLFAYTGTLTSAIGSAFNVSNVPSTQIVNSVSVTPARTLSTAAAAEKHYVRFCFVAVVTNSGTLSFNWAQSATDAANALTVYAGAVLRASK